MRSKQSQNLICQASCGKDLSTAHVKRDESDVLLTRQVSLFNLLLHVWNPLIKLQVGDTRVETLKIRCFHNSNEGR